MCRVKAVDWKLGRQYLKTDLDAALYSEFDHTSYTLIRLSDLGSHKREEFFAKLDKVGRLDEVCSSLELPNESWQIVVLKSDVPELGTRLGKIFPAVLRCL